MGRYLDLLKTGKKVGEGELAPPAPLPSRPGPASAGAAACPCKASPSTNGHADGRPAAKNQGHAAPRPPACRASWGCAESDLSAETPRYRLIRDPGDLG